MAHYIDKDALVAEIENIRKHYIERDDFDNGWNFALNKILSFLNTLEVKEVQEEPVSEELEEELSAYVNSEEYINSIGTSDLFLIARHFANWQKEQMMKDAVDACVTDIRTYKEENEVDFSVMYEKGIIPYEIEQEVKVIVIKED